MSKISVVIPTRNSEKYLVDVLESVKSQTFSEFEIVIVDNSSTDNTLSIAKKYTNKVYSQGPERSSQKNFGANKAESDYILFLDSDAILTGNVLSECFDLGEKGFDMVIIPESHQGLGFWAAAKALERQCYIGDDTIECPWFFKKSAFLNIGGYDENLISGEDWDIFNRLKNEDYKYTRCKSFINHQIGNLKFFEYVNKKRYYGKHIGKFIGKNKAETVKKIPFFRLAYIRNWKLLINHPFLTFGFFFLKVFESLFLVVGMLESKIYEKRANN